MLPLPGAAKTPGAQTRIAEAPVTQRLVSVDALRGFDMFWIVGASSLVYALERMRSTPVTRFLAAQLEHADWEGLRFYDLIFPLFVFIVGVSLVFSLTKTLERVGQAETLKRICRRTVLLYLCGMFYHGGLSHTWPDVRFSGVLNRIALDYFFAAVLFCFFKPDARAPGDACGEGWEHTFGGPIPRQSADQSYHGQEQPDLGGNESNVPWNH
jgi:predicted acyltransferase